MRMRFESVLQPTAWHGLALPAVLERLETQTQGLGSEQAAARLIQHGLNKLPESPPKPWWTILLRQFRSPLIYVLALAALVSISIGDHQDAGFIVIVLSINATIGCYQEWRAEQSSYALRHLLQIRATVLRSGEAIEVSAQEVVPGDVVWLESGNRVPADMRLMLSNGLETDESLLTGESLPVLKDADWIGSESIPLADRRNMVYAGSIVTRGRAKGVVVATGAHPLLVRMESFTKLLALWILVAIAALAVFGVLIGNYSITEMFFFAVALAVSAIPEGLPVAMTIALAVATTRMAQRGVIVRRLTAVEGLGSCTLIAVDKTGTLTCNELMVAEISLPDGTTVEVTGQGYTPIGQVLMDGQSVSAGHLPSLDLVIRTGLLCNESDLHHRNGSWVWRGDAVDIAIQSLGIKLGFVREQLIGEFQQVNQIPFEPEHRFAATFHYLDSQTLVCIKGSPERVLEMCSQSMSPEHIEVLQERATQMAERGFRVLALAQSLLARQMHPRDAPELPLEMQFLGFIGMIDPLRPGIAQAVSRCHRAGVEVMMVTGDHRVTAMAIAREVGITCSEAQVITGEEIQSDPSLQGSSKLLEYRVLARVTPRQKLELVEIARNAGHFVAVTGDGVNDAPALRAANIGVAMGKSGTDVAREASSLVLSDDNFASIVGGIEEGRVAYNNIRKVIYLAISTGAAEVLLMALAILTGLPYLPLLPVQLLWLNLVTNGIQDVALAFESNEGDVLDRKPRDPKEPIFDRLMIERTLLAALTMGLVSYFLFVWLLPPEPSEDQVASARNSLLLLLVLFQNIHLGNCRSESKSAFALSALRSPILLIGTFTALTIHLAAMLLPIGQQVLGTAPLSVERMLLLLLLALTILPVSELHKWWISTTANRR
jgi:magnesium-transporting ATPase (P-type)